MCGYIYAYTIVKILITAFQQFNMMQKIDNKQQTLPVGLTFCCEVCARKRLSRWKSLYGIAFNIKD